MEPHAVVLLSGGLDSATVAAIAKRQGYTLHALSVDYGQRHRHELKAAGDVAGSLGITDHRVIGIDLSRFGGSALTTDAEVPKDRSPEQREAGIPATYVPARNTVLLSLALSLAETLDAADIFVGVNAVDYSGYPDCRPEFVHEFERLANLATKAGVEGRLEFRVHAPLIDMTKSKIIAVGRELGVRYELTMSCYDPDKQGRPCGRCDACLLRKKGFEDAGLVDPAEYQP